MLVAARGKKSYSQSWTIQEVLRLYGPIPEPRSGWTRMKCFWHDDTTASAAYSVEENAFGCLACGMKGHPITLVMNAEGLTSYAKAVEWLRENAPGSGSRNVSPPASEQHGSSSLFGVARDSWTGRKKVSLGLCGTAR